ncbi:CMRF35-like molecule 8 isoform X2 [Pygocentrus nattereri]|uniref:CMRF35-like molecule 8 isoform X2 n=1 Tax=Pygocentrus nattereri TaxID=42514 RepID=UPI001890B98A|nr:CMRF35-like molecule 8 isoform X2 [Pygocentrus nattereri]
MGYSGGGVLIKCRYERRYTSNPKYLCTGLWPFLANQIWTNGKNEWMNMGRFSLFDDTRAAQFWVVIRELTVEDSGTYKCAVGKSGFDVYTPVELNVKEGQSHEKSISVTVHVGGVLNISCRYPQFPEFLCWRVGHDDCSHNITVNESKMWMNEGTLFLHDDGKKILTVNINNLTEGDSGEYWCGAEFDWTSDHGYKIYIKQDSLTDQTATSSSSPSSTPKTPITTSFSKSKTTVNSSLEASTASSVRTLLAAILVVFLIGLFVFVLIIMLILYLQKKYKTRASTQSEPVKDPSHDRISLYVYEEIKDIPVSDAGASTVYATAELPTNPSEPSQTVYDNVQLSTNPSEHSQTVDVHFPSGCDFSNLVYSPAQSPSNSPDQVTSQLPTTISDSSVSATQHSAGTSAEGPTYATVNFSKNADSSTDAVTTATTNKENHS